MNRRLIAYTVGGMLVLGAAEGRAQTASPGLGTPITPSTGASNSRVGTRGANFLEIGLGARAMGMAGAYSALADGLSGLYWNLAGTADVQGMAGGVDYQQLFGKDGLDYVWGGALLPIGAGVIGIQLGQISSGNMDRTTTEFPEGNDPNFGSQFNYTGTQAMLSYGRRLTDRLNVGFGLKFASEGIDNARASYVGVDLGLRFRTGLYGTTIGAALANVGSSGQFKGSAIEANTINQFIPGVVRVNYRTEKWEMPTTFRFSLMTDVIGGSEALVQSKSTYGSLRAVAEVLQGIDTDLQPALGLEYGWRNMVFLRGGKRWMNEANSGYQSFNRGLAFGGGLRLPLGGRHVEFDYAWQGAGELPNTNHFTFEFGF